ncbi:MAG: hypothetical protein R3C32_08575 [Chloroflexota bacterium]
MLARPAERAAIRAAWRIGEPYRDIPVPTIRVRSARSVGLPDAAVWDATPPRWAGGSVTTAVAGATAAGALAVVAGLAVGAPLLGALLALVPMAGLAVGLVRGARRAMADLTPTDTLGAMGRAVAEALAATGRIDPTSGAARVRVVPQPDGYQRCLLDGTEDDARRFAEAMEEVLAPLWEPRWLIARRVVDERPSTMGALRTLAGRLPGRAAPGRVVWHALPDSLAGSRARVAAFERAWARWVSPGAHAVRASDPAGEGILAAHRGEDPFGIETQLRTLWT